MSARALPSPVGRAPDDSPAAMRWAELADLCHEDWQDIKAAHQRGDVRAEMTAWDRYDAFRLDYDRQCSLLGRERRP